LHKEWNGKIQSPPRSISDPAGCFWTNPNIPYYWQNPHIIFPYILVITGLSNPKYHIIYIYIYYVCMYIDQYYQYLLKHRHICSSNPIKLASFSG
jgi:hypothetical protein